MEFPRLIFLDRFIPNASSLPSESRYSVDFQRRRFQKCVSGHARSNGMETRNTLVFCSLGPRKLLLRSRLSTPDKIPSSP
jgi:hypothetical protein